MRATGSRTDTGQALVAELKQVQALVAVRPCSPPRLLDSDRSPTELGSASPRRWLLEGGTMVATLGLLQVQARVAALAPVQALVTGRSQVQAMAAGLVQVQALRY